MTRTQYYTATSVDGFIADPGKSLEWLFDADRGGGAEEFAAFFARIGAMCMGATTYEWVLEHEEMLDHPEKWTAFYGTTPCWVFTHRELAPIPGADIRFVSGDIGPVHDEMVAAAAGRDVWVIGGGDLAGAFADQDRLDDILLNVAPVFLGGGAPLLPRRLLSSRVSLTSVEQQGQFVSLTYSLRR